MKSKSIQQSLFEEILQQQSQSNFPSFSYDQSQINVGVGVEGSRQKTGNVIQYKNSRSLSCSITELQDELLKLRAQAHKQSIKTSNLSNQCRSRRNKNIKTEVSVQQDEYVPPANYSIIYTRRSSLDQSLYDKAVRQTSARKEWALKKQQQKQNNQRKKCTHQPTINANSKQIMNRIDKQKLYLHMKKKKEESAKRIIEQSSKREMKQCSFTPKISDSRNKLIKSVQVNKFNENQQPLKQIPSNSISIFDHLYEDSKARQTRSKQMKQKQQNQQKKTPVIDQISRIITKDTNFQNRMEYYQKRKLQKQLQQKQRQSKEIKESYRPAINSSSHARQKQLSIGEHLYLQSKRESNRNKKNCNYHIANQKQNKYVNKKSVQFYEDRKTMVFYQIFRMLDGDQDGSICINEINLDALPREIVKIIYPLVEELEVMEVQLQEHEFIGSISNLFKTLSIHEKNILLGFIGGPAKPDQKSSTFQPKINNKSKAIASFNQRSHMSIYDYCSIKEAQKQKYLETERIEKTKRELQSCTFQPKIIINKRG